MPEILADLNALVLYRGILQNPLLQQLLRLSAEPEMLSGKNNNGNGAQLRSDLLRWQYEYAAGGPLWGNFVAALLWEEENIFSLAAERAEILPGAVNELLCTDLSLLQALFNPDWSDLGPEWAAFMNQSLYYPHWEDSFISRKRAAALAEISQALSAETPEAARQLLGEFYAQQGCGKLARDFAFHWDQELIPIVNPVLKPLSTLVGYDYQKELLCNNTRAFLNRSGGNHVLLYGEKGTGKSTSVKALLGEFAADNLRLIEINQHQVTHLNAIIRQIKSRGFRFILFIDDLSFEENETEYKDLKSFMEGNLEAAPDNMLIYATSNRRSLIRENWADRVSTHSDVHISDSFQEKQSLTDRFGLTIGYYSPDQEEFLNIVRELAGRSGLTLPEEDLHQSALRWERNYHGRSGRTAQQFITHLLGGQ
jgi:predicted AAA+ superfamily ATPase